MTLTTMKTTTTKKKNEQQSQTIKRITMSGDDGEKMLYLTEHYFLTPQELVKFLIRREYKTLNK